MKTTLGTICSKIGSGATPNGGKQSYLSNGIALIRSQNILDFLFSETGLAYINDAQAKKLSGVTVQENDILLNITGDSVARCCIIPKKYLPARVNQHVAIIRPIPQKASSQFVFYMLQFKKGKLLQLATAGATRNAITKKMIEELEIDLPNLQTQCNISKILSSLDDKIELNTKINHNLEEQAKAIFKSWFVDFEPFRDGKFVDSELGPIPEGWSVGKLSEICNLNTSRRPVKEITLERYISTENMLQNREGITIAAGIPETGNATSFMKDDILISNIRPYFKKIWFASFEGGCSTDVLCFRSIENGNSRFLFNILDDDKFFAHIMSGAKGTKMPRGDKQQMMNYAIVIPPLKIMREFSDMTRCFEEERRRNIEESHHLAALRDTLLPKLMSGEIDVSEVEI